MQKISEARYSHELLKSLKNLRRSNRCLFGQSATQHPDRILLLIAVHWTFLPLRVHWTSFEMHTLHHETNQTFLPKLEDLSVIFDFVRSQTIVQRKLAMLLRTVGRRRFVLPRYKCIPAYPRSVPANAAHAQMTSSAKIAIFVVFVVIHGMQSCFQGFENAKQSLDVIVRGKCTKPFSSLNNSSR